MIIVIFAVISILNVNMKAESDAKFEALRLFFKAKEHAYMEGQKDALEGDIRIIRTQSGDYEWTRSPWDHTFEPMFKRLSEYEREAE